MKSARSYSGSVERLGYLFLLGGLVGLAADLIERSHRLVPFDLGVTLANGALVAIGFVSILIGKTLRRLEDRIDGIEGRRAPNEKVPPRSQEPT